MREYIVDIRLGHDNPGVGVLQIFQSSQIIFGAAQGMWFDDNLSVATVISYHV